MTFIIAEIGINHNGSLDTAKKLIDVAKWAGADAVKFQKRTVEVVYDKVRSTLRESPWGNTVWDQKLGLEFNEAQYDAIADYCEKKPIHWFASAWDEQSLEFLRKYGCKWNKIASAMATNRAFISAVAKERKPVFLSTAMCTGADIELARGLLEKGPCHVTLMHCVGLYPCPEHLLNLRCITTLQQTFGLPVGYSGHEASVSPSIAAVVLGAVAVERHITLDRSMYGSDQAASLEPTGFRQMVESIRKVPIILGDGIKKFTDQEREVANKLRYWT